MRSNKMKKTKTKKQKWICAEVTVTFRGVCGVSPEKEKDGYGGKDMWKRKV